MSANIVPHPSLKVNIGEPDLTGLLLDDQLHDIGRVKISLFKIKYAIDAVNTLVVSSGLSVRLISDSFINLMHNDISKIAFAHEQAEKRIRTAAFAAVE